MNPDEDGSKCFDGHRLAYVMEGRAKRGALEGLTEMNES